MSIDYNKAANDFLNSQAGEKLAGKKDELGRLIDSPDGKSVQSLIGGQEKDVMAALQNGDMAVLQKTLSSILKTEEGARVAEQLLKMMN